jgi:hypothetical protein
LEISPTKVGDFFCSEVCSGTTQQRFRISFATYDIPIVRMTIANLIVFTWDLSVSPHNVNISLTKHIWYKEIKIILLYSKLKKMDNIRETIRKTMVPKGFLSSNDKPTQKAIEMFFVYLSNLPKGWDTKKINRESIEEVRNYFGVDYGFEAMLTWGITIGCAKSNTSKGRYEAMSVAFTIAQGMIGQGVVLTTKSLSPSLLLEAA